MSKSIAAYRGFTATNLKDRAEIPNAGDMTVSGSNVLCVNITTAKIKTALSAATDAVSLLAKHVNVNVWSEFGSTVRTFSGTGYNIQLVNSAPTTAYKMGDFAGYNHGATAPGWQDGGKAAAEANVWVDSGTQASFISNIKLGELKYNTGAGVVLVIFNSSSVIVGWGVQALSGLTDNVSLAATTNDTVSVETTFTLRSFILTTSTVGSSSDIDSGMLCRVPNVDNATTVVKIKQATVWYYGSTGTQTLPTPWQQASSAGLNNTTGVFDIGSISANVNYTGLRVYATLFNWLNEVIGTGNFFNGNYTAYDSITGTVNLGMTNIPSTGYRVVVEFELSE